MNARSPLLALLILAVAAVSSPHAADAQVASEAGPLELADLQDAAVRNDPRAAQLRLLEAQSDLRLRTLRGERLPSLLVRGQGQYQSDVPAIPFELPGGLTPAAPPKDTYDAQLSIVQSLYDPSAGPRRRLEHSRLEESRAAVRATLYALRQEVNEAFFGALLLNTQALEVESALAALDAQLETVSARVSEGAALPSEAGRLRREVLRRRQLLDELRAREAAAREQLATLTGIEIGSAGALALPDLESATAEARQAADELRTRPEYERFRRAREVLERRREALSARERPRLSAFGRGGYGRPGLNPLSDTFDRYWLGGVQIEWSPWDRGAVANERQELVLQAELVETEQAAFSRQIERATVAELAVIDQLERALARDDEIVSLSEQVVAETRLRFEEGVLTSAELVEAEADLLQARLGRTARVVGLARARARFLTLIGYDLP